MNEVGMFNIYETEKPTNKDLSIIFSPSPTVKKFFLEIFENGEKIEESNQENVLLDKTGTYKIIATVELNDGSVKTLESGNYVIDKESPVIIIKEEKLKKREE